MTHRARNPLVGTGKRHFPRRDLATIGLVVGFLDSGVRPAYLGRYNPGLGEDIICAQYVDGVCQGDSENA
jgi:hypothetical protein